MSSIQAKAIASGISSISNGRTFTEGKFQKTTFFGRIWTKWTRSKSDKTSQIADFLKSHGIHSDKGIGNIFSKVTGKTEKTSTLVTTALASRVISGDRTIPQIFQDLLTDPLDLPEDMNETQEAYVEITSDAELTQKDNPELIDYYLNKYTSIGEAFDPRSDLNALDQTSFKLLSDRVQFAMTSVKKRNPK